jgi:hypothetical protein
MTFTSLKPINFEVLFIKLLIEYFFLLYPFKTFVWINSKYENNNLYNRSNNRMFLQLEISTPRKCQKKALEGFDKTDISPITTFLSIESV